MTAAVWPFPKARGMKPLPVNASPRTYALRELVERAAAREGLSPESAQMAWDSAMRNPEKARACYEAIEAFKRA